MIVAKFGGTSVKDAEAMLRCCRLLQNHPSTRLVVVSATAGTTNLLEEMASLATQGQSVHQQLATLETRHVEMAQKLGAYEHVLQSLEELLHEARVLTEGMNLLKKGSPRSMDGLYSIGERLSSVLFTHAFNSLTPDQAQVFDARKVLITDDQFGHAEPLPTLIQEQTQRHLLPLLESETTFITQGFIGKTEEGVTTTLGRGGSDYSAALFAEAIQAESLAIWTDVPGIATTDPRITDQAKTLEEISFAEASELASFGAKILHPTTLWPTIRQKMPVYVGSSLEPEKPGTWIKQHCDHQPQVRALAVRRRQRLMTLTSPRMLNAYGFLARAFSILGNHKISVDLVSTSEISISLTLDQHIQLSPKLLTELETVADIQIEENFSLIALIGNKLFYTPGLAARCFKTMNHINIRLISQGASDHNFCFLVQDEFADETIKRLHQEFLQ